MNKINPSEFFLDMERMYGLIKQIVPKPKIWFYYYGIKMKINISHLNLSGVGINFIVRNNPEIIFWLKTSKERRNRKIGSFPHYSSLSRKINNSFIMFNSILSA